MATSRMANTSRMATDMAFFLVLVLVLDADADMAFFLVLVLETDTAVVDTAVVDTAIVDTAVVDTAAVDTDTALGFFVVVLFPPHGKKEANSAIVLG